ncbi:MAG: hypothetical protein ACOCYZ_02745 [Halococcoides sp.]
MTEDGPGGPLDVATLDVLARRASRHPLVDGWAYRPDELSPRRLAVTVDDTQYPASVTAVRLDVRWYENGDYTFHYVETVEDGGETVADRCQCRFDHHSKPDAPREHFHPPANADGVEPSPIDAAHHLGVLFAVLDWIETRVATVHER